MSILPSAQIKLIYIVKSQNLERKLANHKNVVINTTDRGKLTFEKSCSSVAYITYVQHLQYACRVKPTKITAHRNKIA